MDEPTVAVLEVFLSIEDQPDARSVRIDAAQKNGSGCRGLQWDLEPAFDELDLDGRGSSAGKQESSLGDGAEGRVSTGLEGHADPGELWPRLP